MYIYTQKIETTPIIYNIFNLIIFFIVHKLKI